MKITPKQLLALLLASAAVITASGCSLGGDGEETTDTFTAETIVSETEPQERTVTVKTEEVRRGEMILVNYEHPFIFPDEYMPEPAETEADTGDVTVETDENGVEIPLSTSMVPVTAPSQLPIGPELELVNLFLNKNDSYKISGTSLKLARVAFEAIQRMAEDLHAETGRHDMLVLSAWRSYEDQADIYASRVASRGEEYAKLYVANPGYSEHHTGLTVDISVYTDEGISMVFSEVPEFSWVDRNCYKYGFILRYESEKYDITRVAGEEWHYRYVGVPHAQYIYESGLCYEEYIDLIGRNRYPSALTFTADDGEYVVYSYGASAGETTAIPVPYDGEVTVKGSNCGFFIVTVKVG